MYRSFVTQKGVAYFKSAAMPFFYNYGIVGAGKLKFGIQVGNQICRVVMLVRGVRHSSKVLPCPLPITVGP